MEPAEERLFIERVQVEEGFLDGLDLKLSPGLNVVIGARGAGKTSLIELIRFCLGVNGVTPDSDKRARDHALSVLGGGHVVVTLNVGGTPITVSRSASETLPRAAGTYPRPIIFSQTEIETVGLNASGRLRLLDGFVGDSSKDVRAESATISEIKSLMSEIAEHRRTKFELDEQIKQLPDLEKQVKQIEKQELTLTQTSTSLADKKASLDALTKQAAQLGVTASYLDRFQVVLERWRGPVSNWIQSAPLPEKAPRIEDPAEEARALLNKARTYFDKGLHELDAAERALARAQKSVAPERLKIEEQSRQLRREIEEMQKGAGAIVKQGASLRQTVAQLRSVEQLLQSTAQTLESLTSQRAAALDRLDATRQKRYTRRQAACDRLNAGLGPRIKVEVERAGQVDQYASATAEALRGSGLRYSELATTIAENVSPRELVEAADSNDFEMLSEATGITRDRSMKVLSALREGTLSELVTIQVEDNVSLSLLDGTEYKEVAELSTGQRCTVVLPIILEHKDRIVIVDQPEDHIDNAFIADTVVKAICRRTKDSQIIFSTHNANIPVLGEANLVVQLGSDGQRGFVLVRAPLDDDESVQAITSVMEGGREAFKRRASFYARH